MNLWLEVVIGFALAAVSIFIIRQIYPKKDHAFWRVGLVIAALIYVGFALAFGANMGWIIIELSGFAFYLFFAFLSKRVNLLFLAVGWGLHVLWDILLHGTSESAFVPDWYPGLCLGFDLAIAAYILYVVRERKGSEGVEMKMEM